MTIKREVIRWADHFFISETMTIDEIKSKLKPYVRTTTGYVIAENRRVLAIASTIEPDGEFTEVNYLMKRCILSRD